jgi:hypothetical protein
MSIKYQLNLPFLVKIATCPLILQQNKVFPDKLYAKDVFLYQLKKTNDIIFLKVCSSFFQLTNTFNPIIPKTKI